jgi:hypothetical protein
MPSVSSVSGSSGASVLARKAGWKQLCSRKPLEIPAARLSGLTSGSLRPKLGLCILSVLLILLACILLVPIASNGGGGTGGVAQKANQHRAFNMADAQISSGGSQLQHKESVATVAAGNQAFLAKLFPALAQASDNGAGNLVVSPFSLSSVLAMLYAGATGQTEREIREGLALPNQEKDILEGYEDVVAVTRSEWWLVLVLLMSCSVYALYVYLFPPVVLLQVMKTSRWKPPTASMSSMDTS